MLRFCLAHFMRMFLVTYMGLYLPNKIKPQQPAIVNV